MKQNNRIVVELLNKLNRRSQQLQQLYTLDADYIDQQNILFEYNLFINNFKKTIILNNNVRKSKSNHDFCRNIGQLKDIILALKSYNDNLFFYRNIEFIKYKKFLLLSNILDEQELSELSGASIGYLKNNAEYFIDASFYEIYQTRLALQKFVLYFKKNLRQKFEDQTSLFYILKKILFDPLHLWSWQGWSLIKNRQHHRKQLFKDLKQIDLMCTDALNLNLLNFRSRWQFFNISQRLSLRERTSIQNFLIDPVVQNKLLQARVITSVDVNTMKNSWYDVFIRINNKSVAVVETESIKEPEYCIKGDHQQRLTKFLNICQSIYKADVAKHSFGLRHSIIDGILKYGNSKSFTRKSTRLKKIQPYINAVDFIKDELVLFFPYIKQHKIESNEDYMLLELIDKLVNCTQSYEFQLSLSEIGYQLLDVLKHLNNQLTNYQAQTKNIINSNVILINPSNSLSVT